MCKCELVCCYAGCSTVGLLEDEYTITYTIFCVSPLTVESHIEAAVEDIIGELLVVSGY